MPSKRTQFGLNDGPAGRGLGERLALLQDAIDRNDERAMQDFALEEVWMLARICGEWDRDLEMAVRIARELGEEMIDPDSDQCGWLSSDVYCCFPEFEAWEEWESRPPGPW